MALCAAPENLKIRPVAPPDDLLDPNKNYTMKKYSYCVIPKEKLVRQKFADYRQHARKKLTKDKYDEFVFYSEALIGQIDYNSTDFRMSRVSSLTNSILMVISKFIGMLKKDFKFILNGRRQITYLLSTKKFRKTYCYSVVKKLWKRMNNIQPTDSEHFAAQTQNVEAFSCATVKSECKLETECKIEC